MNHRLAILPLLLPVAACSAIGPDYEPPAVETPDAFAAGGEEPYTAMPEAALGRWWTELEDPVLTDLIERALASNLDLAVALERVRQARGLRTAAGGALLPALDGTGSYSRNRIGNNGFPAFGNPETFDLWNVGLQTGWELDVWGRVRRTVEAARAEAEARIEDLRDVQVLVAAEVARQYVDLRTFQARLGVARGNLTIQERSLDIATQRNERGISPALDVAQAQTNLANTESEIPSLEVGERAAALRLGVLLGEEPAALLDELSAITAIPAPPDAVGVGLPADLLRQRPDVRSAERTLAAEVARIGVQLAEYLPRFQLGGSIGYESTDTSDLFDRDSGFLGIGPSFSWSLFNGGRVRGNVAAQRSAAEAARLGYRQAVLEALEEVELALIAHARERERFAALGRATAASQRTVDLARELYTAGESDFQNVLDSERSLFAIQDRLLASQGELTRTFVNLQLALGGGWEAPEE